MGRTLSALHRLWVDAHPVDQNVGIAFDFIDRVVRVTQPKTAVRLRESRLEREFGQHDCAYSLDMLKAKTVEAERPSADPT